MGKVLINDIRSKKGRDSIVCITAYDYPTARIADEAGVDVILVGDSLAMVVQGRFNTLGVTVEEMIYHTEMATRAVQNSFVVSDMPFMSYQVSVEEGLRNAGRLIKEGGAAAVKMEGASRTTLEITREAVEAGIPVMGHVGYTPQSTNLFGKDVVRGKEESIARRIIDQAKGLEEAGCFAIVLEMVPVELSVIITDIVHIPTIGIGSGPGCDGQIIVWHDLMGGYFGYSPRFVRALADMKNMAAGAVKEYAELVRNKDYPNESESVFLNPEMKEKIDHLKRDYKR